MSALTARRAAHRASRLRRPTPFTLLLGHYLAGRIAETEWQRISATLDAPSSDTEARAALAAFCLDAAAFGEELQPLTEDEFAELASLTS